MIRTLPTVGHTIHWEADNQCLLLAVRSLDYGRGKGDAEIIGTLYDDDPHNITFTVYAPQWHNADECPRKIANP